MTMVVYESDALKAVKDLETGKIDVINKIEENKHDLVLDSEGYLVSRELELRSRAV